MPFPHKHFSFGIEMELYLKPKSQAIIESLQMLGLSPEDTNRANQGRIFRQAMAAELSRVGIATGIDKNSLYDTWTIAHEAALDDIGSDYWPCELISPVFYTHDDDWEVAINYLFANLLGHCDVHLTKGCATHVHVAPVGAKYTVSQVINIIKGAIYYEEPMMQIMHEDRKNNLWTKANANTIPGCLDSVNKVSEKGWNHIFDQFEGHKFVATIVKDLCVDRNVSWNLMNLTSSGTTEFRRPRGVDNPDGAKH
ncbi:hypothetical protein GTR04_2953 [Trichophyton interdigitale]|uniref:Amidoligase enzyme n=1 Tax=Trichophyton interdigitale TaxID=101480 RepID=A0A9P4YH08_9EURO|nr:hypothetical protein GY631_2815 [Trichophyton interdigitale]KAF3897065.1 hypothetical protein GY632_2472 [Trichophyton interdigitale]KAG8209688.1 hypothetical protein GTR04_2953 [Trichophyton interdigitale]